MTFDTVHIVRRYGVRRVFSRNQPNPHRKKSLFVPTRDRGPSGISSEDFPSYARSALVLSLSHREVTSHRPSVFPSISQELTGNTNRKSGTPVTVKSPTVKCRRVRPQRYSTLQKAISGYQPQLGSDRVALINLAARTLCNGHVQQKIVVSLITT